MFELLIIIEFEIKIIIFSLFVTDFFMRTKGGTTCSVLSKKIAFRNCIVGLKRKIGNIKYQNADR